MPKIKPIQPTEWQKRNYRAFLRRAIKQGYINWPISRLDELIAQTVYMPIQRSWRVR